MLLRKHLRLAAPLLSLIFLASMSTASDAQQRSEIQKPTAQKFDEFSFVAWNDLKARLDGFAIEIQQRDVRGYIIVYAAGGCSRPAEAINLARNTEFYLTEARTVPNRLLTAVNGGFRETRYFELWLVPSGAAAPAATATVLRRRARVSNRCPGLPPNTK
jgi:hypothetical protein